MKNNNSEQSNHLLAGAAVYTNTFKPIAVWAQSTGFRTNALRFRAIGYCKDSRIAEDFLINSRIRRHDPETELSIRSYFSDSSIKMLSMLGHKEKEGLREVN